MLVFPEPSLMSTPPPPSAVELDDVAGHRALTLEFLAQAKRQVDIAARQLDPRLYDDAEILGRLQAFVLSSRRTRVRVLILRPEGLEKRGHRLIELALRLSSFIELRVPGPEDVDINTAMLLIDDATYIYRPQADRYEGMAHTADRARVNQLRREFDLLWQRALPASEFRRLGV